MQHPITAKNQSSVQQTMPKSIRDPSGLYSGKVIDVHQAGSSVDVRLFSGDTLRNVRVLFNSASTTAGFRYLSSVQNVSPQQTAQGIQDTPLMSHAQDVIAVIAFLNHDWRMPRVIGFDLPLDSQLHLNEPGLAVDRHESGIYEVKTASGHHERHYPDGSYVIFGSDIAPKDMAAIQGRGQAWNVPTVASINMIIHLAQGVDITIEDGKLMVSNLIVGSGGHAVALADVLTTWANNHTHTTSMGDTSVPNQTLSGVAAAKLTTS